MTMTLPKFMVLKSNYNNKYLTCKIEYENQKAYGRLQFSGEEIRSPYTKYEVEKAKSGNGLVHIRCCYNNKYWVKGWGIVAKADEPEEDQSKCSCTLFKPVFIDATTLRLRDVQSGVYALSWNRTDPHWKSYLCALSKEPDKDECDVFTFIDWESLLILPKHIAFKGDNGKHLNARWIERHQYLQFASSDIGDPTVGNEVFTCGDGSIRIKSHYFGKFWRRNPNWIWADSNDSTKNNSDTLFWPIKVDDKVIALPNLGNNNFCKRLTTEGKISCLNAAVSTISREARLEVEELVMLRYNVNFLLMDARIYDQTVLTMASGYAINRTHAPNTMNLNLSRTETKSSTWNSNISLKLGVKTSIRTGIPFIAKGNIEVSSEFNGAYQWGETNTTTNVVESVLKVTVPPMSKVRVSLIATQGSCDVPFSYTQHDTLTNGKQVTYNMDDGIYVGVNCFNFQSETKQENL